MKKEHPHAQVLRWIADGEIVEIKYEAGNFTYWINISEALGGVINDLVSGESLREFRVKPKPKTIRIGDREIEAPVMSGPGYFIAYTEASIPWFGDERDNDVYAGMQARGLVFASEESARAAQEAITALLTKEPS